MGNIIFEPLNLAATVIYPAYRSYKCLEHAEKYDSRQWLTYWVIFSILYLADDLFGFVLGWVPLYGTAKCLFLCVCAYLNGATYLYSRYLKPFLASKEDQIDNQLGKGFSFVQSRFKRSVASASEAGETFIVEHSDDIIDQLDKVNDGEMI